MPKPMIYMLWGKWWCEHYGIVGNPADTPVEAYDNWLCRIPAKTYAEWVAKIQRGVTT